MKKSKKISAEEAKLIGEPLHVDWNQNDLEQFHQNLTGISKPVTADPETGAAYDGVLLTGRVVLAHMREIPDYFTRLARLQAEVDSYKARRR